MVYITQSNVIRILRPVDKRKLRDLVGDIYKSKITMFSSLEEQELLAIQALFRDAEAFVHKYYDSAVARSFRQYVFDEDHQPAYHLFQDCPRLLAGYENFEIPPEITLRGIREVGRYREWFKANLALLNASEDKFRLRLSREFNIALPSLGRIQLPNSGPTTFNNFHPDAVEQRIDNLLMKATEFTAASTRNRLMVEAFAVKTFIIHKRTPQIEVNATPFTDSEILAFLYNYDAEFKQPLRRLLIQYYQVKYNPRIEFDRRILEQLGFCSCQTCDRHILDQVIDDREFVDTPIKR